jgi:hypothetical protein
VQPYLVADRYVLQLGHDAFDAAHVATDEVLKPVVTVETTLPLPDLPRQPAISTDGCDHAP